MPEFRGTCDICRAALEVEGQFGQIDIGIKPDGRAYTWMRHIDGPSPDCDRYFSRVYEAKATETETTDG